MTTNVRVNDARMRALVTALVLTASSAAAGTLDYSASAQCPSRQRFADEVAAKLGFSPWTEGGPTVRVHIEAEDGGGFTATLTSASDHERHFAADTCRKVADLLVTAVAITLDHPDHPTRTTAIVPAMSPDDPVGMTPNIRNTLRVWSFAPRNNLYQLGLGYISNAGTELTGNIPLGTGHLQAAVAYASTDDEFISSQTLHAHAYYLYPVFYISENSAFEVPIYAGGGIGVQRFSSSQKMPATAPGMSDSAIMPTLAIGNSIQWNGFPVEFMFQMTFAVIAPPKPDDQPFGFDIALRYVFGRSKTRDVVRFKDI